MTKPNKCPKCGGNGVSCVKPIMGKFGMKFEFYYFLCISCDNQWNPYDKVKVVFT